MYKALLIYKHKDTEKYFSDNTFKFEFDTLQRIEEFCDQKHLPKYELYLVDTEFGMEPIKNLVTKIKTKHSNLASVVCVGVSKSIDSRLALYEVGVTEFIPYEMDIREAYYRLSNLKKLKPILSFGNLTLDPIKDEVSIAKKKIDLTQIEYRILHSILSSKKEISSMEVIKLVWKERAVDIKTFNTHFSNLNRKIANWSFKLLRVRNKYIKIITEKA